MWIYYAILSAIFAALTTIFAKIGLKGVDSNLATAIRTCIIIVIVWLIVAFSDGLCSIKNLTRANWIFLILSGIATGISWLFYFKSLQLGTASKVASIDKLSIVFTLLLSFLILKEPFSWKLLIGVTLIVGGSLFILIDK